MKTKTFAVALFAAVMTVTIGMQPVFAQIATGSATVEPKTCGIVFDVDHINYGALLNGGESFGVPLSLWFNSTGNSAADIYFSGSDWKEDGNSTNTVMNANQTHFRPGNAILNINDYNGQFGQEVPTTPLLLLSSFPPDQSVGIGFGLVVDLLDNLFTGNITQTYTFTSEC